MKSKKVITLSLSDLKDLGIIPRKTTNKKKKRRGHKKKSNNTGSNSYLKSDSSHMVGFSQSNPFLNTSNLSTAIQQANLEAIEASNKKKKQETLAIENKPPDDTIITDRFNQLLLPYFERTQDQFSNVNNNIQNGMSAFNKLSNKVYGKSKLINLDDGAGNFHGSDGSEHFINEGTNRPIEDLSQTPQQTQRTRFTKPDNTGITPLMNDLNEALDEAHNYANQSSKPSKYKDYVQSDDDEDVDEIKSMTSSNDNNDFMTEVQSPVKLEQSPATKNLNIVLSKRARTEKGLTKAICLSAYIKSGGTDPKILNSKFYKKIQSATINLINKK